MAEDAISSGQSSNGFRQAPPVLVGREREQVFLREELAAALSGHGRLILLGGEAGIGKTTLARDLARDAAARGGCVLTGHCYDLTNTPPYGPWLDLVATYAPDPTLPSPPVAFAGGILERVTDQAALFTDVRRFFAELSSTRSILVLLEDLHWADPASLELLRHVAPHLRQWSILLLATYRVDELTRRHPFSQQLPALVRDAEGLRLDLRRLDAQALRALVAARYRLPVEDEARLVAYLDQHADGNPFFATEILRALEEEGFLRQADYGWSLGEIDRVVVPAFLRQVIDGRVERLGEDVRQPLAVAAVIGQEAPLALWAQLAGLDDEALLAIVEQAVEAHLLTAERDGVRVRFVHALTREALYEGVLPPRRRLWHQQVAEALMAGVSPDVDTVAYHLQQAGDPRAWEWLVQAADRAQRVYAWLTAAERLQAATDLLANIPGQELTRARLLNRLGKLHRFSDPAAAISILEEADRLASRLGDAILAAEANYTCGVALSYADQFRAGLEAMTESSDMLLKLPLETTRAVTPVESWLADALPELAPIDVTGEDEAATLLHAAGFHYRHATRPWFLASAGQPGAAAALGERFVAVLAGAPGVRGGIRSSAAFAFYGLGIAHAALGRPAQARQAFARSRELFAEYDHHTLVAFTLLNELRDVALTYGAADPSSRRKVATEAEAALSRAGGALRPGVSPKLALLTSLVLDGQWNEALTIVHDLPEPGNAYLRREVRGALGVLGRHRAEPEIAWEQIHVLFPCGPATEPGDVIHQEGLFLQRLAADLCLDAGDLSGAHAWLTAHDAWLAWSDSVLGQANGTLTWARYHLAAAEGDRARTVASEALALTSAPNQPLVRLAAHRLLGEIETVLGNFIDAERHLTAALDLAGTCEAPFERALTLLAIAELHAAQGNTPEVAVLLDDVRHLCTPLEAAPTLARAATLAARLCVTPPDESYPAGLTEREVEVLRLLARRQTDKEIAEALFLGPRT
ncbi:MAG: transcriptional regulator, LuxR family, partial [Thermomicrobiales bacterium]|nr:transcriptional regulator, LuxR family [Thermomicrobiales bacterium]